ncbi:TetR/AcrR family transcriptional regulator [Nocardia caishijiensis]|uniref:TetR family transcriptional regulator n=1 Tax=Nocardia caishijiensis TaxID=184756 RepID=A0ABQ6YTC5_9NOCA|nr:TetR/AcrR family transcriptional regulator [Nocardia caishijiensis]KAF0848825.1 TetR family transcriptional regulator [Nocardia caishijiensis]
MNGGESRGARGSVVDGVRRRPKNRRAQIAATSAAAFGAAGYHGVSMEDIAAALGISSAALYRHYPSKYALFREELLRVGQAFTTAVEVPAEVRSAPERLRHRLAGLIGATLENRATVTLVRWEGRYLEPADRAVLDRQQSSVLAGFDRELAVLRPELSAEELRLVSTAMFGVVTSLADHHAALPARAVHKLLGSACMSLHECELPPAATVSEQSVRAQIPAAFKHELLLRKAVELFHERGYPNVSVEDIASAAGLSAASAVYRFYRGKSDILAAAFRRAADRVSGAIGPAVASTPHSAAALDVLIDQFVADTFDERALAVVYYAEFGHVPAEERAVLRNIQRLSVQEWARLVREVRPALTPAEARFLVHAAFAMVIDLGQAFGNTPLAGRARVTYLMRRVLLG